MLPDKNEKCKGCGCYEFCVSDGFKYCKQCGALLENFEEHEEEEGGIQQTLGQGKVRVKQKDGEKKKTKKVAPVNLSNAQFMNKELEKRSDFLQKQAIRNEELPLPDDTDYLYRLSLRVFSFSRILAKCGYILVKELGFNPNVEKQILSVFQEYLKHCQVAFCHSEQCGSDEDLRFVAVMENLDYDEQKREENRQKKLARRGKGVNALSKSAAAWALLTRGNVTEHLDLESDDEDEDLERDCARNGQEGINKSMEKLELAQNTTQEQEDEITVVNDNTLKYFHRITTSLSKEALRRASQMILNLELLVAVLHSALLCTGHANVLTSDIIRWIREDRFRISRREIRLIRYSPTESMKQGEVVNPTAVDSEEPFLRFPLYEIVRTCTIFHQSLNLTYPPQSFEVLATRLNNNLNLPIEFLERVLLLEELVIPCDLSPMLLKQVDVKMGYNFEQLAAMSPELQYSGFMESFGRKERSDPEADVCDEVLLSTETKLMAYFLLVFKITFDLDYAPCHPDQLDDDTTSQKFDIDTWIHQLEMRFKCWQGHNMKMVLRSSCPIPEMVVNSPFEANYSVSDNNGAPEVQRHRRQAGFQKCIPSEMSFHSTSTLPTVFDVRQNRFPAARRQFEALMEPLNFQGIVLEKEMRGDPEMLETVDPKSEKTFFKDFKMSVITEDPKNDKDLFPFASVYAVNGRPDWIQNCAARKSKLNSKEGPHRFYLNVQTCEDLFGCAESTFYQRFRILLEYLSLLIGEDQKAVYAAFVMLEMHWAFREDVQKIRESLILSAPIAMNCQKFRSSTYHVPLKYGVISADKINKIEDLRFFALTEQFFDQKEISTSNDVHLIDSRNQMIRDSLKITTTTEDKGTQKILWKLCYSFKQFFGILAVKFWPPSPPPIPAQ